MHHKQALKWAFFWAIALCLTMATLPASAKPYGVYRQLWTGLSTTDGSVNALTNTALNRNWPNNPNPAYTTVFTNFETETNLLDGYGQRLRGFIVPPLTGFYVFWIASDASSSLFLSTDESANNRQLIGYVVNSTGPREWTREPNQMSLPVALEAGRRYYIEALHKAAGGGDNLAVRWQLPNGVVEEPLATSSTVGTLLVPFNGTTNLLAGIAVQPADVTVAEGGNAAFSLLVTNWGSVTYQWNSNGVSLATNFARKPFLTVSNVTISANNGQVYSCVVDRKSTRLNSSHTVISYAVFCLKKKKTKRQHGG